MNLPEGPRGSFCPFQSYFTCLGAQNVDKFVTFARFWSPWRWSRTPRDLRGPLFPKMGAPPRREHDFGNLYYQGTGSETMRERLFARK